MASLEERLVGAENELATLRERLDMEAGLAAGRDRDTSDVLVKLRAQGRNMSALRETQVEHSHRLERIEHHLEQLDLVQTQRFDAIDEALRAVVRLLGNVD